MRVILDANNQTLLHWAINDGDYEKAAEFIKHAGVEDLYIANTSDGYTALHIAAIKGQLEIIDLLIVKAGKDLAKKVDKHGQIALHWAVSNQDIRSSKSLMETLDPEDLLIQTNENKYTVLHIAAQMNQTQIVNDLLNHAGYTHAAELARKVDQYGQTALHWAATMGNLEVCKRICSHMEKADILQANHTHQKAVDFAQDFYVKNFLMNIT